MQKKESMSKFLNIILKVCFVAIIGITALSLTSCNSKKAKGVREDFVYLEDGVFKINDEIFYPIMLNYKVDVRKIGDDVVISPARYYEKDKIYESNTKEEINQQFSNHVELMKELGFNTIRICLDVVGKDDDGVYFWSSDEAAAIYLKDYQKKINEGIAGVLDVAASHGMKVMLLLKPPFEKELEDFCISVFKHFADNPTIFAYDLMNEPLYFDLEPNRTKQDAVNIVKHWKELLTRYSPNHLFTIGFSEPIEVFEWDPSVMPVDFVQIHTYHPLRIPNEIWWYSKYIGKPWIIGETALPSDNDSISYDLQALFVKEVYQYIIDCGGIGFGWWEFQDHINPGLNFEANYPGLLNHDGTTTTKNGKEIVGTLKPAAYEFKNLHELKPQEITRPVNYFNMLGYENYVIKGKIISGNKPVEGAVIRGWNNNWKVGLNTYSDENGDFTLVSNDSCVHFEISAPGLEKVKFNSKNLNLQYKRADGKEHDFSDLENVMLEYHKISFYPYMKNDSTLFDFNEDMFNKAKFETDMGTIELKKM